MTNFLRKLAFLAVVVVCAAFCAHAQQTVTVTGDLKSISGTASATDLSRLQVCFTLVEGDGSVPPDPRVGGAGILLPFKNKCFGTADGTINSSTGHFSVAIVPNDVITVSGVVGGTLWSVTYLYGGVYMAGDVFSFLLADVTEDLNTKTAATVSPFVAATPTDNVYLRKDGGNMPAASLAVTGGSVLAGVTATNSGVFTNTQMNDYLTSILNGGSTQAEWARGQGAVNHVTEAIAAAVVVPATSTVLQANGLAGYVSVGGNNATNVVAVYGQGFATAATAHLWGSNFVFGDGNFASVTGTAGEFDCNVQNTGTTGGCIQANGSFTGNPTLYPAYQVATPVGGGKWSHGFLTGTGATNIGILLNPIASGASQLSQKLVLSGDAGAATMQSSSGGDWLIYPSAGKGVGIQAGSALTPRGTVEVNVASGVCPDALNVNLANGFNLTDGGNTGLSMGFCDTGTLRAWLQGRNTVGANNTAYPISLQEKGGRVLIGQNTDNATDALQISGSLTASGAIKTTIATGTAPLVVASTTPVANLTVQNCSTCVLNGTPTGTGIPTVTLKKGSGAGNYTTASTTYVVTDATNLCYTVTIPTGWKLLVNTQAEMNTATAAVTFFLALTDNASCATANAGLLAETTAASTSTSTDLSVSLTTVIAGDGAAHNIALQYKTSNGADSATVVNSNSTRTAMMTFLLTPSN